ncbi:hypothetical protein [Roseateles sp. L2-2]|uniref:hypothetical protein n=1 Tax=Roseateles sp. L2-2 TaxID=3422597 RepID=UPI003D36E931
MSESIPSKIENAWDAIVWATIQRDFPLTPLARFQTAGRPSGFILLVVCNFIAVLTLTFAIHVTGFRIIPGSGWDKVTAADSALQFGASTLNAVIAAVQTFRVTPWAVSVLGTTAAASALQAILIALVMLLGRVLGVRSLSVRSLCYWMIQPVTLTLASAAIGGFILVNLRLLMEAFERPFSTGFAVYFTLGCCFIGMLAPYVLLRRRRARHGWSGTPAWESVALVLLTVAPVSALVTSTWWIPPRAALNTWPTIHVRSLSDCVEDDRICTIALNLSNAPELELESILRVRFEVSDSHGNWSPSVLELKATLLNEADPLGFPIVLTEDKRRYVRIRFRENRECPLAMRAAFEGPSAVAIRTTFLIQGESVAPGGKADLALVKSDNPNYPPGTWPRLVRRVCANW